jgi:hypothetical protein
LPHDCIVPIHDPFFCRPSESRVTYLVEVDDGLPELLLGLVEVPHTDLTEVTGMVLVKVGPVVVLTTGHTTTTGVLTVLANATVTGRHMTAAGEKSQRSVSEAIWHDRREPGGYVEPG